MNAKMEKMIGCFNRMLHDRGKELDCSFNGGFHEPRDIRIREHGGVIENREVRSEFGYQFQEDSSIESGEASHQPLMEDLNVKGFSEALRQRTVNKSEILEAKIQAICNLVHRSPIGDEDMGKVEMEEVLVESGEVLVDENHANTSNGMECGTANATNGTEAGVDGTSNCVILGETRIEDQSIRFICVDQSSIASKSNGDLAGDKKTFDFFWKKLEMEHVKVKLISEEFEDPFYGPPESVLIHLKFQLMLAIGVNKPMVEVKSLLAVGWEVCMLVLIPQDMCAAGMVVQWIRKGVG